MAKRANCEDLDFAILMIDNIIKNLKEFTNQVTLNDAIGKLIDAKIDILNEHRASNMVKYDKMIQRYSDEKAVVPAGTKRKRTDDSA